jgi:hypothetical protein
LEVNGDSAGVFSELYHGLQNAILIGPVTKDVAELAGIAQIQVRNVLFSWVIERDIEWQAVTLFERARRRHSRRKSKVVYRFCKSCQAR